MVVLTVAHLCHTPECRQHVKAMCQGCHLHYDRDHHRRTSRATREAARRVSGEQLLPFDSPDLSVEADTCPAAASPNHS